MPRIEPVPYDELSDDARSRIEAGLASGMYTQTVPLQILAHSEMVLRSMDEGYKAHFRAGSIDDRLQELLRLRSAQLNACQPCSISRKESSTVAESDVACLVDPAGGSFSRRETLALAYLDRFATDHHSIGADTYRELAEEFSAEEIIELGWLCGQSLGMHRFMHTLDVLGEDPPAVTASTKVRS